MVVVVWYRCNVFDVSYFDICYVNSLDSSFMARIRFFDEYFNGMEFCIVSSVGCICSSNLCSIRCIFFRVMEVSFICRSLGDYLIMFVG